MAEAKQMADKILKATMKSMNEGENKPIVLKN
jgi:hypothetical protein